MIGLLTNLAARWSLQAIDLLRFIFVVIPVLLLMLAIGGAAVYSLWHNVRPYIWIIVGVICLLLVAVAFSLWRVATSSDTTQPPSASPDELSQHGLARRSTKQAEASSRRINSSADAAATQAARSRPSGGKALFQYTDAWLRRKGLYEGMSIEKSEAVRIAGTTAIRYHLKNGNFEDVNGFIRLTEKGLAHFIQRRTRTRQ